MRVAEAVRRCREGEAGDLAEVAALPWGCAEEWAAADTEEHEAWLAPGVESVGRALGAFGEEAIEPSAECLRSHHVQVRACGAVALQVVGSADADVVALLEAVVEDSSDVLPDYWAGLAALASSTGITGRTEERLLAAAKHEKRPAALLAFRAVVRRGSVGDPSRTTWAGRAAKALRVASSSSWLLAPSPTWVAGRLTPSTCLVVTALHALQAVGTVDAPAAALLADLASDPDIGWLVMETQRVLGVSDADVTSPGARAARIESVLTGLTMVTIDESDDDGRREHVLRELRARRDADRFLVEPLLHALRGATVPEVKASLLEALGVLTSPGDERVAKCVREGLWATHPLVVEAAIDASLGCFLRGAELVPVLLRLHAEARGRRSQGDALAWRTAKALGGLSASSDEALMFCRRTIEACRAQATTSPTKAAPAEALAEACVLGLSEAGFNGSSAATLLAEVLGDPRLDPEMRANAAAGVARATSKDALERAEAPSVSALDVSDEYGRVAQRSLLGLMRLTPLPAATRKAVELATWEDVDGSRPLSVRWMAELTLRRARAHGCQDRFDRHDVGA